VATGGGGTVFEQHVNAAFLSILLVRGIPPIIHDCALQEVHFQTKHLGWQTDDTLLVGVRADGGLRKMAIQIKRSFTLSANNEDCQKAFRDFWRDFHHSELFDRTRDSLVLVIQRGTDVLLEGLGALLDCAHASKSAVDFGRRLSTPGLLSKRSVEYTAHIRKIVQQVSDIAYSDDSFWNFLKVLHLLSYDLATSTNQAEAMIKTMLAYTASGHDRLAEASATWSELVEFAGKRMSQAASITLDTLPESVRKRHSPISSASFSALRRMQAHSQTVLLGIRTTLGRTVELPREDTISKILNDLDEVRAVLITGPGGFGKSALAKQVVCRLGAENIGFAFRAEEFAVAHLDQLLHDAQIGVGAQEVFSLLAGQGRKIILAESIERLLESSQREAFLDLLRLIAADTNWRLILTCRDYSADTVKAAFVEHAGLQCRVFDVPELTDDELAEAVNAIPALRRPASHQILKKLFRNPYYLDKAAMMSWPSDATLPADERAFREKFWREVVRREDQPANGMPRCREQILMELCLRRARALEPWVRCDDLDRDGLDRLRNDNLIAYAEKTEALAAPVHDALEDWVALRWIGETFAIEKGSLAEFEAKLGTCPAIRRAYRKWLGEFLDSSPADADKYVTSVVVDTTLSSHFRDDTLVAALLSSTASGFLERIKPHLLQNNGLMLRHVILLVRVACKTTPSWIRPVKQVQALWFVPYGSAWPAVLRLVRDALDDLPSDSTNLIVGLLSDWAAGVSVLSPSPDGIQDAANIAYRLLPQLDDYSTEEALKDVLKVVIKIPEGDEQAFAALAQRASVNGYSDHVAAEFAKFLLTGIDSTFACKAAPDVVIKLAQAYFKERPRNPGFIEDYDALLELERIFGLKEHLDFEFREASAIRGPFNSLLRFHPAKGMAFILDLMNYACDNFAQRPMQYVAAPSQITLTLPDGCDQKQWCEERLWNLYRGTSVGPNVLQCALMALEEWLLQIGEIAPEHLQSWLIYALRKSNNVAITSVVASVAMAFPHAAGEAALVLLTCRDLAQLIQMDIQRYVQDSHPPSKFLEFFPERGGESQLYMEERRASDQREHRKRYLEWVAIALAGPRVYAILDAHHVALPPEDQQDDEDRHWRLALHRMDFRRYQVISEPTDDAANTNSDSTARVSPKQIVMSPQGLEKDLEAFAEDGALERQEYLDGVSLFMWGASCFSRQTTDTYNPDDWRKRLQDAQEVTTKGDRSQLAHHLHFRDAPGLVAAVCARDHWAEMDQEKQQWVIGELNWAVSRDAERDGIQAKVSRNQNDASRPAAYILPRVLTYDLPPDARTLVRESIAVALTHVCHEVVVYAVEGVGAHLTSTNPTFVLSCVRAMALRASLLQQISKEQREKRCQDRIDPEQYDSLIRDEVKAAILSDTPCADDDLVAIGLNDWWGADAISMVLSILGYWSENLLTRRAFSLLAESLAAAWKPKRNDRGGRSRDYRMEYDLLRKLAEFCLRLPATDAVKLCEPLLACVDNCPDDVETFVRQLALVVDNGGSAPIFWSLWQEFATRVAKAPWLAKLDIRRRNSDQLLSAMLLGLEWKEDARHWPALEGFAELVDQFFISLPPKPTIFRYYAHFLSEIGERSLPQGFVHLSSKLKEGDARIILSDKSSSFLVEFLLGRWVYSKPAELKSCPDLREAVLHLLDELVASGSSAAYRMRDDFVTPGSSTGDAYT